MNHHAHVRQRDTIQSRRSSVARNGRTAVALNRFVDAIAQAVGAQLAAVAAGDQGNPRWAPARRRPTGGAIEGLQRVGHGRRAVARVVRESGRQGTKMEPAAFSPTALPRTAVVVVAAHDVVRRGLVAIFEERPEFLVTGAVANAAEALEASGRFRPDVVLLSPGLPEDDAGLVRGILGTRPACKFLIVGSEDQWDVLLAGIDPASAACLLEGTSAEALIMAVRDATRGLPPSIEKDRRGPDVRSDAFPLLADHQAKLLPLLAEGKTNREIAVSLGLSEHTVKTYVSQILRRLNLKRRAEAAALITRQTRITA